MSVRFFFAGCVLFLMTAFTESVWAEDVTRVLVLSGQNNHNWRETTPVLKRILEDAGGFTVDVTERPDRINPASLKDVDVILSNWNTLPGRVTTWPEPLREAVLDHVREGGGFVVVHAGGTMFHDWDAFQRMIGATWGEGTGHGPIKEFEVHIVDEEHPVTAGLEDFTTTDELWHNMVVNGPIHVLATAHSTRSGRNEPVAFVTDFGQGNCFNLVLGHDVAAMQSSGFRQLLTIGTRWAGGASTAPSRTDDSHR